MTQIPDNATPISTEQLFAIIGELTVQVRVLQAMLRNQLGQDVDGPQGINHAVEERSLQSKDN